METWYRLGTRDELLARVPFAVELERHRIAVFHHDGRFRAISDICNHRGGPLSEGRVRGEFVMCPVACVGVQRRHRQGTGRVRRGTGAGVPCRGTRDDGVYVQTTARSCRAISSNTSRHTCSSEHPKPAGAPPRVLGLSTTAMDADNPRFSTSDALLESAMRHATDRRRRHPSRPPARSRLSRVRGELLQGVARLHVAVRDHRARPGGPAHAGVRGTGALGRRRADRDADPVGQRFVALLSNGRATQLHPESDHDRTIECLIANKVAGVHHHRRPGQHPGGGRIDADFLGRTRVRLPGRSPSSRTRAAGMPRTCRTTSGR